MIPEAARTGATDTGRRASRGSGRARVIVLAAISAIVLTTAALVILVAGLVTLFKARRFYTETLARWLGRFLLRIWGVDVVLHRTEPFPQEQSIYISNHPSTLDLFVLISLGLPNTRYFMRGWLRYIVPIGIIGYIIRIFFTPGQGHPTMRKECFANATRVLRRTGESAYLSPEGERRPGGIGPFNKGVFHLATELGAPIVPLYIDTPAEISPGRGIDARPGVVNVYSKPPVLTCHWKIADLQANRDAVRRLYLDWEAEVRSGKRGAVRSEVM